MGALICETVTAATMAELRARRDAVPDGVDIVELRLDGVRDPDVGAALDGRRLPAIVTCRPAWEGGRFGGGEEDRRRLLSQALDAGAEYVDVEWRASFATDLVARTAGRRLVLSVHDFSGVPVHLPSLYRALRGTGAEIVKIAITARRLCDTFALESIAAGERLARREPGPAGTVFVAMGASGLATRILPHRFGSRWTYVGSSAPGQISAARLVDQFRFRQVSSSAAVFGVVGVHASESLSPALHNAAFRHLGLDAVYLPLQTGDFDDFLAFAERLPLAGASVTMPFKEAAMCASRNVDETGRAAGAVNALRREAGGWAATNTDLGGFLDPIRDFALQGRRVAIVGAGGAARAVAVAVARCGARVSVFARNRERARQVAALAGGEACSGLPAPECWDMLVNATPVEPGVSFGVGPAAAPPGAERIVYDLVYQPAVTRLLQEAQAAGCRTVSGLEMLIAQARRQIAWWTGQWPEERVMRDALETGVNHR